MMAGIFAIVGPSGVGKDTVMEAASAAAPEIHLVRRVITRPAEMGGENFEGVSDAEFSTREARGEFALTWPAHGLRYGIPASVHDLIAEGRPVLFNGSRKALPEAARVMPRLRVILLTAHPDILADRLAGRGRETPEDIARRLARARLDMPAGLQVTEIDNSGALDHAVDALLDAVLPKPHALL